MIQEGQIGIYIHWPFCSAKCPYCDFNSHVRKSIDDQAWQDGYLNVLDHYAQQLPDKIVRSVFFGGGTPSLMNPNTVSAILERIQKNWRMSNDVEITLEANPTSVEADKFQAFRSAGVNRVSLGVQSLNDADLKFLGRQHSAQEALDAVEIARKTFERYSFDLMYARPEQSLKDWEAELHQALPYVEGHMSLYQLTIERNTPFYMSHQRGKFSMPKEELAADFYMLTQDIMEEAGLPAYEVSNHAKKDEESRHNLIYWHYGDYIGVGPGAHGRLTIDGQKHATYEHASPDKWLEAAQDTGVAAKPYEALSNEDRFLEAIMMGLRLKTGITKHSLESQAGRQFEDMMDMPKLNALVKEGWVYHDEKIIRLEREGLLRLNAIVPYILKAEKGQKAA